MAQGDQDSSNERKGGENPSAPEHEIITAIDALGKKYEAAQESRTDHDQQALLWTKRAAIGVGIYTLLTLAIVIVSLCQLYTARDTEKRQLRAYIGVVPPADNQVINPFGPPNKAAVHLVPRNFGLTPAYGATHETGMGVLPYPIPKEFTYPIELSSSKPNPITIHPGKFDIAGIITAAKDPLAQGDFDRIQDGQAWRFYVWGTIKYKDAFNDPHFTNFCISFYNVTNISVQREPCLDHNDSD